MYKVLLADDDYPVIEFLMQEVPWERLNLQCIGYAEDGLAALAMAQEDMPDLLITDIGMPGMDGIELIQQLKQLNAGLRTVILSCHDEFQYTRQAVKLNVQDYVLKESMEIEEITEILEKLVIQLEEDRSETEKNERLIHSFRQNEGVLKEKLVSRLLISPIFNELQWQAEFEKFGVNFSRTSYFPVVCYLNEHDKQLKRLQSEELLTYLMTNVIEEILHAHQDAACFHLGGQELMLLFSEPGRQGGRSGAGGAEHAYTWLRDIQSALRQYVHIDVGFITGKQYCRTIKELKKDVHEMMDGADQRFYLPAASITSIGQLKTPFASEDLFQYYAEMNDALEKLLIHEAQEPLAPAIAEWFRLFRERRFHPEELKSFILRLVMDQYMKVRSSAQYFDFPLSRELLHQAVFSAESIDDLEAWLASYWKSLLASISDMSKRSRRLEIVKAQKYVQTHLDKKISLEEVAELLHLNPAYFSRLYKKETQESFITYVTRVKMEKAKEWLETTNKTVEEISYQLGYDNKSYFNKCFKSVFQLAPSQLQHGQH